MAREFAKPFYDSKEWQKVREYCLMRDRYMCVKCGNADNTLEVHHIIHLSPNNIGDVSITLNPENLITLCRDCHFAEHKADKKEGIRKKAMEKYKACADEYIFDCNGYLVPVSSPSGA